MRQLDCFFLFIFSLTLARAQQRQNLPADTLSHQRFLTMVNINKDQSYVSLGNGLGNQIPILFEAQLSPSYFVSRHHRKWALMINPQVQVRMLNEYSVPIQVPSYHLYLTYDHAIEFWKRTFLQKIFYDDAIWSASLVHHSNGQNGKFYTNDTTKTINLSGGSFSVNFLQFGVSSYTLRRSGPNLFFLREIKVHTELYPSAWCDPNLKNIYGFYRLFGTFGIGGPWRVEKKDWVNRWLQNSRLELKSGWIFGPYRGYAPLEVSKRLIVDLLYKYYPPWFDEIALFVRFYSGQDYYNIYFERQLTNLTIGIRSNTIDFSNAIHYLQNKKSSTRE
jgi:hypothetical protein